MSLYYWNPQLDLDPGRCVEQVMISLDNLHEPAEPFPAQEPLRRQPFL